MLLRSSFRISPHQSLIGADDIHNSHYHVPGILFPTFYVLSRCHYLSSFFLNLFFLYDYRIEAMSSMYSGQLLIQKHGLYPRLVHIGKIGN